MWGVDTLSETHTNTKNNKPYIHVRECEIVLKVIEPFGYYHDNDDDAEPYKDDDDDDNGVNNENDNNEEDVNGFFLGG